MAPCRVSQVWYCSTRCQSTHWTQRGHKEQCARLPKVAAAPESSSSSSSVKKTVESKRTCAQSQCRKPGASLTCGRCKGASYCSRACQKVHWSKKGGNHKAHCRPTGQLLLAPPAPPSPAPPVDTPLPEYKSLSLQVTGLKSLLIKQLRNEGEINTICDSSDVV